MKKRYYVIAFILLILITSVSLFFLFPPPKQKKPLVYAFSIIKQNPVIPVKNQGISSTCWAFSGLSFFESELLRRGKDTCNLSEMYVVRCNYEDKADAYIRLKGEMNFAPSGSFADVAEVLQKYGIVPDSVYRGTSGANRRIAHREMDKALRNYMKSIVKNPERGWEKGFDEILASCLNPPPSIFSYCGREYTPLSFFQSIGLNAADYVSLTSFTHHPFYTAFSLEIPDNWRKSRFYNLPVEEMAIVADSAIMNGYTVYLCCDVSEIGFSGQGICIVPKDDAFQHIGSRHISRLKFITRRKEAVLKKRIGTEWLAEKTITQQMRQSAFDNRETTDDHCMHLFGIAKDQHGAKYYMVKNSVGKAGAFDGIWYLSEAYFNYKVVYITVNKKALPQGIAAKTGLLHDK